MKTLEELKIFCKEYYSKEVDIPNVDDWVILGGYDINFTGSAYSVDACINSLRINAYKDGWKGSLPEPLYTFNITGDEHGQY